MTLASISTTTGPTTIQPANAANMSAEAPKVSQGGHNLENRVTDDPVPRVRAAKMANGAHKPEDALITVEPLRKNQMQPTYAQTLEIDESSGGSYGKMINCLGGIAGTFGSIPCCFICPNPYKEVKQGYVGLVTRYGQFYKSVDPGLTKINPFSESLKMVNVQIQVVTVPQQQVMTKDNVNVIIDSVIYYHVKNPYKVAFAISDVRQALIERAQSTLRHVAGARLLQNLITEREEIAHEIEEIVENTAEQWGIEVESILIKDILFSQELQQSLSSAAQSKRIGESKVIAARAEVDAARLMREAADILSSPAAIQIRTLEAYQAMAKTSGAKVIFVPTSLQGLGTVEAGSLAQGGPSGSNGSNGIQEAGSLSAISNI